MKRNMWKLLDGQRIVHACNVIVKEIFTQRLVIEEVIVATFQKG